VQKFPAKRPGSGKLCAMKSKERIPVTVLTGFLGAGKTTLLNYLLSQKHGHKCAIIINEFGAISIDNQLVVGADEEILELNNGCLCCRVRGDLVRSLGDLLRKQKRFDYVLIETTGIADPNPVVHTFKASELAESLRLDGIVTVVDAKHLEKELDDGPEPQAQIAAADLIVLNKTDLVSPADLNRIEARIRKMNPLARIHKTERSQIDPTKIFNIKARELTAPMVVEDTDDHDHDHGDHEHHPHDHDHGEEHEHDHDHSHQDEFSSFYLTEDRPLDLQKVEAWLSGIISSMGERLYRSKGILYIKGQPKRVVFHGVQTMFEASPERFWNNGEKRQSQLVFIGRNLDEATIRSGFQNCVIG
jgi:G3E family GTPase